MAVSGSVDFELDVSDYSVSKYSGEYYLDESHDYYVNQIKFGKHISFFEDKHNLRRYFENSNFNSDLVLHIIEMDEEFLHIKNTFFVDFKTKKVIYQKTKKIKKYLRMKVRSDVFRYVLYNGLSWEDLSIGFQARFYREPDNYNFDFWNHFSDVKFLSKK